MEWTLIIGLIMAGLVLLVLEVLVIPGVGVVGFFGFGLIVYSIYMSFAHHGVTAGIITTIATFFISLLVVWLSLRSKTWKRISLETDLKAKVNEIEPDTVHPGDKGVTIGRIAPMGKAMINGHYFEVKSGGAFIDPDRPVVVTRMDENQIFVKEYTNN